MISRIVRFLFGWLLVCGGRKRFEWTRSGFEMGVYNFGDDGEPGHWSLKVLGLWVRLWRARKAPVTKDGMDFDSWSISIKPFSERSIYLHWRDRYKFIYFPWAVDWIKTEYMNAFGVFEAVERNVRGKYVPVTQVYPLESQSFPFAYLTKDGKRQETTVTVKHVIRMTWQWVMFRRLRLPLMQFSRCSLDIWFADEMGNERGSWKGGVMGTGCTYVPGEPVEVAIRRYENMASLTHWLCR